MPVPLVAEIAGLPEHCSVARTTLTSRPAQPPLVVEAADAKWRTVDTHTQRSSRILEPDPAQSSMAFLGAKFAMDFDKLQSLLCDLREQVGQLCAENAALGGGRLGAGGGDGTVHVETGEVEAMANAMDTDHADEDETPGRSARPSVHWERTQRSAASIQSIDSFSSEVPDEQIKSLLWTIWQREPGSGGEDSRHSSRTVHSARPVTPGSPGISHTGKMSNMHRAKSLMLAEAGAAIVRAGDDMVDETSLTQWLMVAPSSWKRLSWDLLSVLIMGYDMLFLPLQAFQLPETRFSITMTWLTTVFWTVDIVFSFFIGFTHEGLVEMRPAVVRRQYFITWFPLDILVVVVDWLLLFVVGGSAELFGFVRIGKALRIIRVMRMFRLFRVLKVATLVSEVSDFIQSEAILTVFTILKLTAGIAMVNHFIACAWFLMKNAEPDKVFPSWVSRLQEQHDGADLSFSYLYTTALHWSLTQFTPASMEVVPGNVYERVFAIGVILFAMISFSSFVSSITTAMTYLRTRNIEQAKQRDYVRRYITDNKVPVEVSNRVYSYLRQHNQMLKRRVHEHDITGFDAMPESLRITLHAEVYLPVLLPHPFFHHLSQADEAVLTKLCHETMAEMSLLARQELFATGNQATKMWFVRAGVVDYFHGSRAARKPSRLGPGAYMCEMVLWMPWENRGRLTCNVSAELVSLDHAQFLSIIPFSEAVNFVQAYARSFVREFVLAHGGCMENLSDIWGDFYNRQAMAQRAFAKQDEDGMEVTSLASLQRRMGLSFRVMRLSHNSQPHTVRLSGSRDFPGIFGTESTLTTNDSTHASFLARLRQRLGFLRHQDSRDASLNV